MKGKKEKPTWLVLCTIVFLSLFIALPPILRVAMPKKEEIIEEKIIKSGLYCEKVVVSESKKIMVTISYENDIAMQNKTIFMNYTPTAEDMEIEDVDTGMTVEQEITFLKAINGVSVEENASQTVIKITGQVLTDNPTVPQLDNYMAASKTAISYYESLGYYCSKLDY